MTDLAKYVPLLVLVICFVAGKLISSSKLPNWIIPIVLPLLSIGTTWGLAAATGTDGFTALQTTIVGLLTGSAAVGLHQAVVQTQGRKDGGTGNMAPGESGKPDSLGPQTGLRRSVYREPAIQLEPNRPVRVRNMAAMMIGAVFIPCTMVVLLPSCTSTATLVAVAQVIAVAAPYVAQVVVDIEQFVSAYFAAHPDPATEAKVQADLQRVKSAAAAIGQLATEGVDVSEAQYVAAMQAFAQAYADLYVDIGALKGVSVQAPGQATMKATPGTMVLVIPPPSTFTKGVSK